MGADHGHGDDIALVHVLRARLDLDEVFLPHVDLADPEMIRVRIAHDLIDAARHDVVETLILTDDILDRDTGHRETIREFFRRPVEINILF